MKDKNQDQLITAHKTSIRIPKAYLLWAKRIYARKVLSSLICAEFINTLNVVINDFTTILKHYGSKVHKCVYRQNKIAALIAQSGYGIAGVGMAGFEPAASTSQMWRDTGLRYIPKGNAKVEF